MTIDGTGGFRQRLLDGLATSIEERGYAATKIDDIVRHAKTSKRTFYAEFDSKKECYLKLLGVAHEVVQRAIEGSVDPKAPWRDQVRQAVFGYLTAVVEHPKLELSAIRDLPTLDPHALELQRATMDSYAALLFKMGDVEMFREAGIEPLAGPRAPLLLGGLRELVARTIEDGGDVMALADVMADVSIAVLELPHR